MIEKITIEPNKNHFSASVQYPNGWGRYTPYAGTTMREALDWALELDERYGSVNEES